MAIDPYEDELKPSAEAIQWLRQWLRSENATLDVIYVLSSNPSHSLFDACTIAEQRLRQAVSEFDLDTRVNTRLIYENTNSTRNAVYTVVQYAQEIEADMIFLTSYGRRWVGRLLLGSFADRILAISSVPILFLNQSHSRQEGKRVLFPTDFSPASRRAFDIFLEQFKDTSPEIVLVHVLTSIAALYDYSLIDGTFTFPKHYFEDIHRFIQKESARWMSHAQANGFEIQFILEKKNDAVTETLNQVAKNEKIDLIALASSKVQIPTRILGSVASSLFYQRTYPIWICGPEVIQNPAIRLSA